MPPATESQMIRFANDYMKNNPEHCALIGRNSRGNPTVIYDWWSGPPAMCGDTNGKLYFK